MSLDDNDSHEVSASTLEIQNFLSNQTVHPLSVDNADSHEVSALSQGYLVMSLDDNDGLEVYYNKLSLDLFF